MEGMFDAAAVSYQVSLEKIIKDFNLEAVHLPKDASELFITTSDVNRPGLPLVNFFEHFDSNRIQIMGKVEDSFLSQMEPKQRELCLRNFASRHMPCIVVTRNLDICPELLQVVQDYKISLLRTTDTTSSFMGNLIGYLKTQLAPRITRHGVLVEVYGEGILLLGDSGVGKSETAVELVKRGHRLIADDAVEIKKVSNRTLVGSAPEVIRHFIELRGIGIVDIRQLFGMGAIKMTENINLVIYIENWDEKKVYDRMGLENEYTEIMGIKIPCITLPVKPGRNLAVILEVAAMNNRQKRMGYNAAEELTKRIMNQQ